MFLGYDFMINNPEPKWLWILVWAGIGLGVLILSAYGFGYAGSFIYELADHPEKKYRIPGMIFGGIGFIVRPFPVMMYGGNKKWIMLLTVALPFFIIGVLGMLFGLLFPAVLNETFGLPEKYNLLVVICGGLSLFHALLALCLPKCPECKCVMSEIDYDEVDSKYVGYGRRREEYAGRASVNGSGVDVYHDVWDNYVGEETTYVKVYTCKNCGAEKHGMKFSAFHADKNDEKVG